MSHLARTSDAAISAYTAPPQTESQDLRRLWLALLRRRRLFAAIWAGFVLAVAVVTFFTPKSYTATARLMPGRAGSDLNTADRDTALPVLNALVLQSGEQSAETLAELARQENLSAKVIGDMHLQISPQALMQRVSVRPVVNTPILNLSVTWSDRQGAAAIANDYAGAFIDREREFVRSQATAAIGFLTTELPAARKRMTDSAAAFASYQARYGILDAGTHEQDLIAHISSIDQKIEALAVDTRESQALLANVNEQMSQMPSSIDTARQVAYNPVLADLQSKLAAVNTQLSAAQAQYTDQHPTVVALRQQRSALLAQIAAQPSSITSGTTTAPNPIYETLTQRAADYRARIDGNTAQLGQLRTTRRALTPLLGALPSQVMQFTTLQQEAKRASGVYDALEQKYSDAIVAQATAISDITIVQAATADAAVKRPSLFFNLIVAVAVGLLLALGAIFMLDLFERRVRSEVDTRATFGLPLLGRIPAFDPPHQRALPWVQSMTIEAFLHLCVTLRLKSRRPLKTLAITSACRGDGKSVVALNLGKAMANLQPRVLLIDADMRRPTLHKDSNIAHEPGLSEVLAGERDLPATIVQLAPNLDLLPSGCEPANPVALLQSPRFAQLLEKAGQQYAMVIVDSPALTSVTDGLLISARVDGTVLVVAADATDESAARDVVSQFAALGIDNVLGVVLNKDTKRMEDYSDYFARSYGPVLGSGAP